MENELIVVEDNKVAKIFEEGGSRVILDKIKSEVNKFVPDVSTAKGRKEIISMASKVSKSKTLLEGHGKKLVEGIKAQAKVIDAERKTIRDELDSLRDEVRKPVTDWEDAEKERVELLEDRIEEISNFGEITFHDYQESLDVQKDIDKLKSIAIDESFEEFELAATKAKEKSLMLLEAKFITLQNAEKEATEAERLEKERLEKEQKEREDKIAQEAADKAKREAEEKAKKEAEEKERKEREEKERLEREKLEAQLAQEKAEKEKRESEERAEREKKEAAEKAEREKREAVEAEKRRQEEEKKREAEETRKREENKRHRNKIIGEVKADLKKWNIQNVKFAIDEDALDSLIEVILDSKIRHLKIEF